MEEDNYTKRIEPPLLPATLKGISVSGNRGLDEQHDVLESDHQKNEVLKTEREASIPHNVDDDRANLKNEDVRMKGISSSSWCTVDSSPAPPLDKSVPLPAAPEESTTSEGNFSCSPPRGENLLLYPPPLISAGLVSLSPSSSQLSFVKEKTFQPSVCNRTPSVPPTPQCQTPPSFGKRRHSLVDRTQLRMDLKSLKRKGTNYPITLFEGSHAGVGGVDGGSLSSGLLLTLPTSCSAGDFLAHTYGELLTTPPLVPSQFPAKHNNKTEGKREMMIENSRNKGQDESMPALGSGMLMARETSGQHWEVGGPLAEDGTSRSKHSEKRRRKAIKEKDVFPGCKEDAVSSEVGVPRPLDGNKILCSSKKKKKEKCAYEVEKTENTMVARGNNPSRAFSKLHSSHSQEEEGFLNRQEKAEKNGERVKDVEEGKGLVRVFSKEMKPEKTVVSQISLIGGQVLDNALFSAVEVIGMEKEREEECVPTSSERVEIRKKNENKAESNLLPVPLSSDDAFITGDAKEITFFPSTAKAEGLVENIAFSGPCMEHNGNEVAYQEPVGSSQRVERNVEENLFTSGDDTAGEKNKEGDEILEPVLYSITAAHSISFSPPIFSSLVCPSPPTGQDKHHVSPSSNGTDRDDSHQGQPCHPLPSRTYHHHLAPRRHHRRHRRHPPPPRDHPSDGSYQFRFTEGTPKHTTTVKEDENKEHTQNPSKEAGVSPCISSPLTTSSSPSVSIFSSLPFCHQHLLSLGKHSGSSRPPSIMEKGPPNVKGDDNTSTKSGIDVKEERNEGSLAVPVRPTTLLPTSSTPASSPSSVAVRRHADETRRGSIPPIAAFSTPLQGGNGSASHPLTAGWRHAPAPPPPPPPLEMMPSPAVFQRNDTEKWEEVERRENVTQRKAKKRVKQKTRDTKGSQRTAHIGTQKGNGGEDILGSLFTALAGGSALTAARSLQQQEHFLSSIVLHEPLEVSDNFCCSWEEFSVVLDASPEPAKVCNSAKREVEEEGKIKERKKARRWRKDPEKDKEAAPSHPVRNQRSPSDMIPSLPETTTVSLDHVRRTPGKQEEKNEAAEECPGVPSQSCPPLEETHGTPNASFTGSRASGEAAASSPNHKPHLEGDVTPGDPERRPPHLEHSGASYGVSGERRGQPLRTMGVPQLRCGGKKKAIHRSQDKKCSRNSNRSSNHSTCSVGVGSTSMDSTQGRSPPLFSSRSSFSHPSIGSSSFSSYTNTLSSFSSVGSHSSSFSSEISTSCSSSSGPMNTSIPLKEGCSVPLPSRYFVDFAFRFAHPQNLLPYAEEAIIYEWDLGRGEWRRTFTRVVLSVTPFSHGNMRSSYYLIDLSRPQCRLTAKRYLSSTATREQYFDDVSMHSVAGHWARLYNSFSPPKPVKFVPAAVLELLHRKPRLTLAMEPLLTGTFDKYNNNCGYLPKKVRWTPQAFSHFTFVYSQQQLMIVDIQGVNDIYTDPQILSPDGEGYGRGNLGMKGIRRFFKSHVCNPICFHLGLSTQASLERRMGGFPLLHSPELSRYTPGHHHTTNTNTTTTIGDLQTSHVIYPVGQKVGPSSGLLWKGMGHEEQGKPFFERIKGVARLTRRTKAARPFLLPSSTVSPANTSLMGLSHPVVQMAAIFSENLPPKASNLEKGSPHHHSRSRGTSSFHSVGASSSTSSSSPSVISLEDDAAIHPSPSFPSHSTSIRNRLGHHSHLAPMTSTHGVVVERWRGGRGEGTRGSSGCTTPVNMPPGAVHPIFSPSPPNVPPPSHHGRFPFSTGRGGSGNGDGKIWGRGPQENGRAEGVRVGQGTPLAVLHSASFHSLMSSSSSFRGCPLHPLPGWMGEASGRGRAGNYPLPEHHQHTQGVREPATRQGNSPHGVPLGKGPSRTMDPRSGAITPHAGGYGVLASSEEECAIEGDDQNRASGSSPLALESPEAKKTPGRLTASKFSHKEYSNGGRLRALVATEKVAPSRATPTCDLAFPQQKQ